MRGKPLMGAAREALGGGTPRELRLDAGMLGNISGSSSRGTSSAGRASSSTGDDGHTMNTTIHTVVAKKKLLRMRGKAQRKAKRRAQQAPKEPNPFSLDSGAIDVARHVRERRGAARSATQLAARQSVAQKETSASRWRRIRPVHDVMQEDRAPPTPSRFAGMVTEPPAYSSPRTTKGGDGEEATREEDKKSTAAAVGAHKMVEMSRNVYRMEMEIERKRVEVDRIEHAEWLRNRSLTRMESRMNGESESFENFVKQSVMDAQDAERDAALAIEEGLVASAEESRLIREINELRKTNEKLSLRSQELQEMSVFLNDLVPPEEVAAGGDASTHFTSPDQLLGLFREVERRSFFVLSVLESDLKDAEEMRMDFEEKMSAMDEEAKRLDATLREMGHASRSDAPLSPRSGGAGSGAQTLPIFQQLSSRIADAHSLLLEQSPKGRGGRGRGRRSSGNAAAGRGSSPRARSKSANTSGSGRSKSPRRGSSRTSRRESSPLAGQQQQQQQQQQRKSGRHGLTDVMILAQIESKMEGLIAQMDAMPPAKVKRAQKHNDRDRRLVAFAQAEADREALVLARAEEKIAHMLRLSKVKPTKKVMTRSLPFENTNGAGEGKAMRDARRRKEAEDMERFF